MPRMQTEVDVAIIGAGFGGIGAAHQAARGGHRRLRDPRARGRARRHLAGEHVPRLRLRRPVAPVLVLLRAQPGLEPLLRAAAGDPRLPRARRPRAAASTDQIVYDAEVLDARWDDAGPPLARRDAGRATFRAQVARRRRRAAAASRRSRTSRAWTRSRARCFHSAELGPRPRPRGRARRRDRHGRVRRAVHPARRARRPRHLDVYQRTRRLDHAPRRPRASRAAERRLLRRVPAVQRAAAQRHLLRRRAARRRPASTRSGARAPSRRSARLASSREPSPTRSCARSSTPNFRIGCKRIIFSDDYLPALAQPARRARHGRASPRSTRPASAPLTARTGPSTRSSSARASRCGTRRSAATGRRPRGAHARRRVGARPARRPTSAPSSPASRTCSS